MDELINNRYKIIGKIGEGAFGAVYHCSDLKNTTKQLVVKVEKSRSSINHLAVESKILAATKGVSGFPKCFGLFEERDKRFLILQRLGMSISRLFKEQKKPFNLKTIVNMTMQLL
jgi:predicted Ser/Thr protein kinase